MENTYSNMKSSSLQAVHEPIRILSNSDFEDQGWSGTGTKIDPYFIYGLLIEGSKESYAVFIANVTVYFAIRNCRFVAEEGGSAIRLRNSTHGLVEDCTFYRCFCYIQQCNSCIFDSNSGSFDMILWECMNCFILNNELDKGNIELGGIVMDNCVNCSVVKNTVKGSIEEGLWMIRGLNCSITDNEFTQNAIGISLLGSNNTKLLRNQVHDNKFYGIELYCASNITAINNTLVNNGMVINLWGWGWNGHEYNGKEFISTGYTFAGNFVNGKPLGFFESCTNDTVDTGVYGQVILLNCQNMEIQHGFLNNVSVGIQVLYSHNCSLESIIVKNCISRGIEIFHSKDVKILDCTLSNNFDMGIYVEDSSNVQIRNNSVTDGRCAIGLWFCNKSVVVNNSATYSFWGIALYESVNCSIINNTILYNHVGISLESRSRYNIIYGNKIGWNEYANAFDESGYNQWDDGVSQGNAWSDYSGTGEYEIEYKGKDHYPTLLGSPSTGIDPFFLILSISVIVMIVGGIWYFRKLR
jgi:parallel beta-helix repeat protein